MHFSEKKVRSVRDIKLDLQILLVQETLLLTILVLILLLKKE